MAGTRQYEFPFLEDVAQHGSLGSGLQVKRRRGTGLIVAVARHDHLSHEALEAIARFRLNQYVAAGLYDEHQAWRYRKHGDPSLSVLAGHDLHVAVGDTHGRFLAYLCIQSALPVPVPGSRDTQARITKGSNPRLQEHSRPLFPVETEYGNIYSRHQRLQAVPISEVRELTRLLRNQDPSLRRDPIAHVALAEVLIAGTKTLYDPASRIEAIVGCIAPDARRVLYAMGIPIAYAPEAPVIGANLGGGSSESPDELLWTRAATVPGRFWPCAIATADLRADHDYYDTLDQLLETPDKAAALRAIATHRLGAPRHRARYSASGEQAGGLLWTDRPLDPVTHANAVSNELDSESA